MVQPVRLSSCSLLSFSLFVTEIRCAAPTTSLSLHLNHRPRLTETCSAVLQYLSHKAALFKVFFPPRVQWNQTHLHVRLVTMLKNSHSSQRARAYENRRGRGSMMYDMAHVLRPEKSCL